MWQGMEGKKTFMKLGLHSCNCRLSPWILSYVAFSVNMVTMSWTLFPSWEKSYPRPGRSHPSFKSVKGRVSRTLKSVTGLFFCFFWLNSRFTVLITLCLSLYFSSHVQM